ncbi:MvaI/BcnI family restriction endonuclease [Massilia litorea]|uniref:MvaI/BcnI restriction endonuclease family protein n=1 Tax=Massilia litorea TaxID=2769491 RepID=A0A7L9U594_9BURK|nr:MvaI/BcnI family restriction endonuclease [Massilia litorea]QOL50241.1 MvaI/BcnI restriction endonuclease family protein [Massilia litorea]
MQFVPPNFSKNVLRLFGEHGIPTALVSPTATALTKSIIDATEPFRDFLAAEGIHDFASQPQGEKRTLAAEYVTENGFVPTTISLYRPVTKKGDPRTCFYNLKAYARADDVLALVHVSNRLYIVNVSDPILLGSLGDPSTPLGSVVAAANNFLSSTAIELLGKIKAISSQGPVRTVRSGDTGVGATLEYLLGIASNSKKTPDYHGIEIKASRHNRKRAVAKNRVNLFSQVPQWNHPDSKPAREVLMEYGYPAEGRRQLYCTVDAIKPNSQGLMLHIDADAGQLKLLHHGSITSSNVFSWQLAELRARLQQKHPESFWVKADAGLVDGVECFHYHSIVHTIKPLAANLSPAIANGTVTLDLTMSLSGSRIRDHGYLFKIWPGDLPMLFPIWKKYNL